MSNVLNSKHSDSKTQARHLPTIDGKPYCEETEGLVIASRFPGSDYSAWIDSITCHECKAIGRAKNT